MPEEPVTRPSLLVRLRDHRDNQAWGEFVELYAPLIYTYARKRGLQDADAADLTQNCLRQVAAHVGRLEYDPRRGSFRAWLFTIVRNRLRNFQQQPRRLYQGSGDSQVQRALENTMAPETDEAGEWEREYRLSLLAWAAEQVRPQIQETTWQAFWQTTVESKSGKEVAQALGLTVAAVYLAKSRVVARLRAVLREVQGEEEIFSFARRWDV
ncbi:MAG TPA: sigma-70 family RNA polymerase sigma factor [Gemmataceae bacterium]|nr:sigma-70 family RNA polymerase sigma factor [Gemmataceae bacterium]